MERISETFFTNTSFHPHLRWIIFTLNRNNAKKKTWTNSTIKQTLFYFEGGKVERRNCLQAVIGFMFCLRIARTQTHYRRHRNIVKIWIVNIKDIMIALNLSQYNIIPVGVGGYSCMAWKVKVLLYTYIHII